MLILLVATGSPIVCGVVVKVSTLDHVKLAHSGREGSVCSSRVGSCCRGLTCSACGVGAAFTDVRRR